VLHSFKGKLLGLFDLYLKNDLLNHNDKKRNGQLKIFINNLVSTISGLCSEEFSEKRSRKSISRKRFENRKTVEAKRSLQINTGKKS
jgi:hypothetical protein